LIYLEKVLVLLKMNVDALNSTISQVLSEMRDVASCDPMKVGADPCIDSEAISTADQVTQLEGKIYGWARSLEKDERFRALTQDMDESTDYECHEETELEMNLYQLLERISCWAEQIEALLTGCY
jgi:hypothetical protein